MSAQAVNKKVHVINGGNKYLQVKSGNNIAFWATDTSNTYTWLIMPALADESDATMFSLRSVDDEDKWLVVDTETTYTSSQAPSGGINSDNNKNILILTDEPTDSDGNKKASFKITTAADSSLTDYSSYLLVYDESKYLRDWWNIAQCGSAQTGNDAKYSSAKFVDITE